MPSLAHAYGSSVAKDWCGMHMSSVVKQWTLEELHSLPDDGNKYELVRGELFVTPAPTVSHETIASRLSAILTPYVKQHGLGLVFHPRAVMRFQGSEVEPDLMVRQPPRDDETWDTAPTPILIVEIWSPSTRRRDQVQKRSLYMDAGVAEYWMVDSERRVITVVRSAREDVVESEMVSWKPEGVSAELMFDVALVFGLAPGTVR
jgi:Uma2 family endonuclease